MLLVLTHLIAVFVFLGCVVFTPMHALLSLLAAYLLTGYLFVFMGLEFTGLIFIAVYAGAIVTLFIFVLMITNYPLREKRASRAIFLNYTRLYVFVSCVAFSAHMLTPYVRTFEMMAWVHYTFTVRFFDIIMLGDYLYDFCSPWMLSVTLILLVALISVVATTDVYKSQYLRRRTLVNASRGKDGKN